MRLTVKAKNSYFSGDSVFESHDQLGLGIITTKQPHHYEEDSMVIFTSNDKVIGVPLQLVCNTRSVAK